MLRLITFFADRFGQNSSEAQSRDVFFVDPV